MSEDLLLVHNAAIWYSGQPDNTWMTFNQSTGLVTDVGRTDPPLDKYPDVRRRDVKGKRIFPGFNDSHLHVSTVGLASEILSLLDTSSIEELQARLKAYVEENNELKLVLARSWEQEKLGRYPCKEDLDAVCSSVPVVLVRICGHILVCNSVALETVNITKDTPDPPGGTIDRYSDDHPKAGEATGILRETAADVVRATFRSTLSPDSSMRFLRKGLDMCLKNGITCVQTIEDHSWRDCCTLVDRGEMPIRLFFSATYSFRQLPEFPEAGASRGSLLLCDRIKLFADGSLGSCTAALSLPYLNSTQTGLLVHTEDELTELIHDATMRGYRVEIHVIGDRGADVALNALQKAKVAPERRPILTHCQILREDILDRMVERGVVANIQPQFLTTDSQWMKDILPSELIRYSYCWKTMLQKGIKCGGGSDAPVETPEPLKGIYDAIFRPVGKRDPTAKVFQPTERLTVQEAVDLYTKGGAQVAMREHDLGQLLPGFQADFVVIDSPVDVAQSPEAFLTAGIAEVWVAGQQKL